jgi:hypothetical protein
MLEWVRLLCLSKLIGGLPLDIYFLYLPSVAWHQSLFVYAVSLFATSRLGAIAFAAGGQAVMF